MRVAVISAFFAAVSMVLGKYLAIGVGDVLRFSFENLPIIFIGFAFGPIIGAVCGAVADLVGCVLVGYAINPIITLGAVIIGAISGIYRYIPKKGGGVSRFLSCLGFTFLAHILGSVLVKTFGLAAFYDMPLFALMLWRALNYLIVGSLESVILFYLINNKTIANEISRAMPKRKK